MKIAIYGPGKTGTSALYYKIRDALAPAVDGYFEPRTSVAPMVWARRASTRLHLRKPRALVAKFLPFVRDSQRIIGILGPFDREILLVRDPRDCLVSLVLYSFYHADFVADEGAVQAAVALIRAKEADPQSVTLHDIVSVLVARSSIDVAGWTASYHARFVKAPMAFHAARPDIYVMRYEDLVQHRYDTLSRYLGVPLTGEAQVDQGMQRVVRTKRSGDWVNWFTASDILQWKPILEPHLRHYYPDASWDVDARPVLLASTGSDYVARVINERRAQMNLAPLDAFEMAVRS